MPEVATTTAVQIDTEAPPTVDHCPVLATDEQHNDFRSLLSLLRLITAYNYGHSMLPDPEYTRSFDAKADARYRRFTREGILKALATIFVRNDEVIATTQLPFSTTVVASVSQLGDIQNVAVVKNTNNDDDDETRVLSHSPQANFIERDRGTPFPLAEYVQAGEALFNEVFSSDVCNAV